MGKKILVADDDPAIVDVIRMMLELDGYSVDSTGNGESIYKLGKNLPDVLLLDIWMSGIDGREICKNLKKDPATKHIPVILISASRDIRESAKEAGADDFLAKPFDMNELLSKVKSHTKG